MIPDSADARWKPLLTGERSIEFKSATAGMLFARLRRALAENPSAANYADCVAQARKFLAKYEGAMREDLDQLFG